jgi:hypothetical protein
MTSTFQEEPGFKFSLDSWHSLATLYHQVKNPALGSIRPSRQQRDNWLEEERASRPPSDDDDDTPPGPEPPHTPSDWLEFN